MLKIIQVTNILVFVLRAFETLNAHVLLLTLQFWDFSRLFYATVTNMLNFSSDQEQNAV